jgi:hypothetical protein
MYLNHYPQTMQDDLSLTMSSDPAYTVQDAENMLEAIKQGCTASCTDEDAEEILAILQDGESLEILGFTDADQEWIETLYDEINTLLSVL